MSDPNIKNPILENKYGQLTTSTDPIAIKIVNAVNSIYNDVVVFNNAGDIPTLDNSIINIQDKFQELISLRQILNESLKKFI